MVKLLIFVLALAPAFPRMAFAQQHNRKWIFGGEIGLTSGQPTAFRQGSWFADFDAEGRAKDPGCWGEVAPHLGLMVGHRITQDVHVEAMVGAVAATGGGCDFLVLPLDGVEVQYTGRTPGPDYMITQVRAILDRGTSTVRPRGVVGLGWIPKKHIPSLFFGGGFSAGKFSPRVVSELGLQIQRVHWIQDFNCSGNCSAYPGTYWTNTGTSTPLQLYARIGVEF